MKRRVVIASGGTGGHFYPTLSIAREVVARGGEVRLVVAGHHADEHLRLAGENDLEAHQVPACRLPHGPLTALSFPFRLLSAVSQARSLLRLLTPDVVLGMGSFASAPACVAATREGVPLVLHEGNAWMGRANRYLSRWARVAGVALPLEPGCRVRCPTVHVGMPLRQALIDAAADHSATAGLAASMGLRADTSTILVFGGSQGARFLNTMMARVVPRLAVHRDAVQVIHLTGSVDNEALIRAYAEVGIPARVQCADAEIQACYRLADLVICRAGASSICELALFGKPAILIPLPTAAEDHQTANARLLATRGAAVHVAQDETTATLVTETVLGWLAAPEQYRFMAEAIRGLAVADAGGRMAALCCEVARRDLVH